MTRHVCELRNLVTKLEHVLEEMMASDLERRPFVIVEDTVGASLFVQFARSYKPKTGALLFDVPRLGITLKPCPDVQTGAIWAQSMMLEQFGVPLDAVVSITLDGDPAN